MSSQREIEIKERIRQRMERRRKKARNRRIVKTLSVLSVLSLCSAAYYGLWRGQEEPAIEAQAAVVEEAAAETSKLNMTLASSIMRVGEEIRIMAEGDASGADPADSAEAKAGTGGTAGAEQELPDISALYAAHVAGRGWSILSEDNTYCMAYGGSYITNMKATLQGQPQEMSGTLRYRVNLSGSGWLDWAENVVEIGSPDGVVPLEAVSMELTGDLSSYYSVYYSVLQDAAWTPWVSNGAEAGISGAGKRVDGIRVSIRKKDAGEPGETKYLNGIDPSKPMVALTYDDGPSTNATPRILAKLNEYGGRATFFMVGNRVAEHASIVQQMAAQGCEVANHTYDHTILTKVGADKIAAQINGTNQAVAAACGVTPKLMRPPGGGYNDNVRSVMASLGMPAVLWSIDTLDWKTRNAQNTINTVLSQVQDGDIILMHDLYTATADASDTLIPELVNRGYQLVTVSELAAYRGGMTPGTRYGRFRP